jgi:hypothetical protein
MHGALVNEEVIKLMEERSGEDVGKLQRNMNTLDACGNPGEH